jgi:hypothetical protein
MAWKNVAPKTTVKSAKKRRADFAPHQFAAATSLII